MQKKIRVLFVCMGNICRSPAAECVFRYRINEKGGMSWVDCDSAGTISEHAGEGPDHRMQEELQRRGIPVVGKARQIKAHDLQEFDLIVPMDQQNFSYICSLPGADAARDKIKLFTEFCLEAKTDEVPDPYYGGRDGFRHVVDLVEDGVVGLIEFLTSE